MPDGLYDQDVLLWAERQADLLRRLQAGDRVNESIDWDNLIEEVESVGLTELHECQNGLEQALVHLLKLILWPADPAAADWRFKALLALADAHRRFTKSMEARIDLDALYRDSLRRMEALEADQVKLALLGVRGCPFEQAELLADDPDLDKLLDAGNAMWR